MQPLVSKEEFDNIQEQFNKVIKYSTKIKDPQTDELFSKWYEAKQHFISSFGGLIYTYPSKVKMQLTKSAKQLNLNQAFEYLRSNVWIYDDIQVLDWFDDCVGVEGFFNNLTTKSFTFFSEIYKKEITIPKGMKVGKSLKFFIKNKEKLKRAQDYFSIIMQKNKIEGYLCISVHPLDFLSLSENTHNWRSCHALDGEYAAGNLSYMMDTSTFIIYLRSDEDVKLPNFPSTVLWNNKKWRMLMYLSQDCHMLFAGRQYPFECADILNNEINRLLRQANIMGSNWIPWSQYCFTGTDFFETGPLYPKGSDKMVPITEIVEDKNVIHYNDLLHSSSYTEPYWTAKRDLLDVLKNGESYFEIGGPVKCCNCGKDYITVLDTFLCHDCINKLYGNYEQSTIDEPKVSNEGEI